MTFRVGWAGLATNLWRSVNAFGSAAAIVWDVLCVYVMCAVAAVRIAMPCLQEARELAQLHGGI